MLGERVIALPSFSPSSKSLYYHRNTKIPTERRGKLILRARWHTISNASLATCGENNENWNTLYLRLDQLGHVVFSARSKAEALKEIPRAKCHVLISDINLPDGTGWDLMQEAGKSCPNYAIAISGYGMKADLERSAESGFRHHLVKPVSAHKLNRFLHEATNELKDKE